MKYLKVFLCLFLGFMFSSATLKAEKKEKNKIYAVGVAISFQSPIVYYTDVQELVNGEFVNGLLKGRDRYSYQFKGFLETQKEAPNQTCAIYFAKDKGKLEKKLSSLLRRYKKESTYTLIPVSVNEFEFENPFASEDNE